MRPSGATAFRQVRELPIEETRCGGDFCRLCSMLSLHKSEARDGRSLEVDVSCRLTDPRRRESTPRTRGGELALRPRAAYRDCLISVIARKQRQRFGDAAADSWSASSPVVGVDGTAPAGARSEGWQHALDRGAGRLKSPRVPRVMRHEVRRPERGARGSVIVVFLSHHGRSSTSAP